MPALSPEHLAQFIGVGLNGSFAGGGEILR